MKSEKEIREELRKTNQREIFRKDPNFILRSEKLRMELMQAEERVRVLMWVLDINYE